MPDDDPFRPSEYTAALLRQLRLDGPCTGRVLDMGTGSGVLLAALATAGADALVGVDIEPAAVRCTRALLQAQDVQHGIVHCGDLWEPLASDRFDLVLFNPPQLPVQQAGDGHRLLSWSDGGEDGRAVLDRFLAGLPRHLAPGGRTLITHSGFVGLAQTVRLLAGWGLHAEVLQTCATLLPQAKLDVLPPGWLERHDEGLHRIGPFVFSDFHVVEIRHGDAAALG
ncbi:HemK2/MTQ2 family protein methyltransferase [Pseudorhodoferax soli]|uniref:Release factor glutamine methyltransferase n=1 Tax=Pseudorhodoferax soli TaxID=545864 RepID=A0A368Y861_9BURK|nr:HemK2/MTQ2 family protein methyltransferase [Pseudorhodoferax soli]RCW76443.1 release factor glutamine methyltransferase [Pseudorhodoferax soli]